MVEKIEINRNGNKVEIFKKTGRYGNKYINTVINGKEYGSFKLNDKNQWMSSTGKIGVQLDDEQAETIRKWNAEFDALLKKENKEKLREIENKPVQKLSFKFHNYLIERYMHTENVSVDGKDIYSKEGYEIMNALRSFSLEDLDKLGIKREDDIWQTIELTEEQKTWILEKGAENEAESMKKIVEKRKQEEEKKAQREQEEETKKAEMLEKAKATGEKQIFKTQSVLLDDGNLLFKYTWIHPDGTTSTSEFYDGD